ncbi:MAG: YggT family protein [Betaproteobacteria bacterium]|nr:YggT family protein [Betaproteobacteria bacterium]
MLPMTVAVSSARNSAKTDLIHPMLAQTLIFVVSALGDFFAFALITRFLLQWVRAPARNQLSEFVAALTNFVVIPTRRFVPGLWGLDLATLLLALLTETLKLWLILQIKGAQFGNAVGTAVVALFALAAIHMLQLMVYLVMGALILQAILSWVNPYSPIAPILNSVTRPFLRPFQRVIPLVANVDLSPLAALLVCQLILAVPLTWLETNLGRLI